MQNIESKEHHQSDNMRVLEEKIFSSSDDTQEAINEVAYIRKLIENPNQENYNSYVAEIRQKYSEFHKYSRKEHINTEKLIELIDIADSVRKA